MKSKDLLSVSDLSSEDIRLLISNAIDLKAEGWRSLLSGKVLVLMFEKPSLRTRVSFEIAMRQLGRHSLYLSPDEVGLGKRESVSDVAQVLSRYANAIVARTFSHQTLEIVARYSTVPLINARLLMPLFFFIVIHPPFIYFSVFLPVALFQDLITSLFFPVDIGHMKAVLHSWEGRSAAKALYDMHFIIIQKYKFLYHGR